MRGIFGVYSWGRAAVICGMISICPWVNAYAQTTLRLYGPSSGANARSSALGDAYVAESFDASTLYWNPAALTFLQRTSIVIDYVRTPNNSAFHYAFAAPLRLSEETTIALGGIALYRTPTEIPGTLRGARQKEYSLDIAAAHKVGYSVSLGVSTKLHYAGFRNTQLLAAFTSLGIFYAPSPEISYGLTYEGIELASSLRRNGETEVAGWEEIPRRFAIGIAMRYPSPSSDRQLTISVSNEKHIGVTGLFYKMGIEVLPWRFLALRTGFLTGPATESLRYGVGIFASQMEIAYTYIPYSVKGKYHQLSMFLNVP